MQNNNQKQCRFCGEFIDKNTGVCPICRQSTAADAVLDLRRLPDCPVCKIPIYPAKINGHSVYHCEECEGTAISKETMMKLQPMEPKKLIRSELVKEHVRPPYFEPREKPPFLICPFCRKKMIETKFTNMTVDVCEKCGAVWFDAGKEKHINEILGSYKMKRLKDSEERWGRR
ncbi:MAG: zf-TFIIB domain-containing protein [Candidatus Goldbacteria bacterium]|nr:zf-TFIIB domain-containing protein [Candidatus Goldiibacteriota bacterium]